MSLGEQFESVLAAAQTGAEWAVTLLYRELHPAVLGYLRTQQPGEGEDIESETWLDVARSLPRFQGAEGDFRRWVFAIARRRLIDFRRQARRRRTELVPVEALGDHISPGDVEEEVMEGMSTQEALERISALPPDQGYGGEAGHMVVHPHGRPCPCGRDGCWERYASGHGLARLARDLATEPVTGRDTRAM
jgi:RNA polymerase sigma-70 factor (ECF subfamily)